MYAYKTCFYGKTAILPHYLIIINSFKFRHKWPVNQLSNAFGKLQKQPSNTPTRVGSYYI